MATLLLAAAGSAVGGAIGGTVLGIGSAVIGQAVGATIGGLIDQRAMGGGSATVETGRLDTYRVQGAEEGTALPYIAGRVRLPGQMIWSTKFLETVTTTKTTTSGGKGSRSRKKTTTTQKSYSYSVSFAVALCEGEVARIGRIWADGKLVDQRATEIRFHPGSEDQAPDPLIAAVEGAAEAPAYRGTAYLVFDRLELGRYGNRIPQINVEVFRQPAVDGPRLRDRVEAVALIPGTGEYALASAPVNLVHGAGRYATANVNSESGQTDFVTSLDHLQGQFPGTRSSLLVASWFGDDLRAGRCAVAPKVEQRGSDGDRMPWRVSGIARGSAGVISTTDGRVNYGGTPADGAVIEAIGTLRARGVAVTFYPFLLMDIPRGNGRADPYGGDEQGAFPWRGRIIAEADGTAGAAAEIAAFFGAAEPGQFSGGTQPVYTGPTNGGYRRFILHYAHLCARAGGVEAFCIGSEMRTLLQTRDADGSYPAVAEMVRLAADVRSILGPDVKISYAADWSEYFGHQPADGSGDVFYHLDPLWADANIDFVAIDNYMPLSDWRDGDDHLDLAAGFRAIHDPAYLAANVEGGEGYDWYYASDADRAAQVRTPITDGAYGDDHVFRYKDLRNWWGRPHFDRPGGVRNAEQTAWMPRSKPIWFTEFGCPAVDKGTNQPNVFLDEKSSENALPYFSTGARDDFIQYRYLDAVLSYWAEDGRNPVSEIYDGPMLRLDRCHVWAWDTRPWPEFPNRLSLWSDGVNYGRGHWISGRLEMATLADVTEEVCARSGVTEVDVSGLHGGVGGIEMRDGQSARSGLQPLMLAFGFDAVERDGRLVFVTRTGHETADLRSADLALVEEEGAGPVLSRGAEGEQPDRVRLRYIEIDHDYQRGAAEALDSFAPPMRAETSEVPLALHTGQAQGIAERLLDEGRIARDGAKLSLPPSRIGLEPGDVVRLDAGLFRLDRIEEAGVRGLEGTRVDPAVYVPAYHPGHLFDGPGPHEVGPVLFELMDLPLLNGDEVEHAPYLAATSEPWPGAAAAYISSSSRGFELAAQVTQAAVMGTLATPLAAAPAGQWSAGCEIELVTGELEARSGADVLDGANAAALRNGVGDWEVIQFRDATLVAPDRWRIGGLLRGQAGTEFVIPASWAAGTRFVLLDDAAEQLDLPLSARGLERQLRVGPAARAVDDESYVAVSEVFEGVGLRPYAPVHLRARRTGGDLEVQWIRRTRIDGDLWGAGEVPLSEEREAYLVQIVKDGVVALSREVGTPLTLLAAGDLPPAPFDITVSQISARFGPGAQQRMTWND